MNRLSLAIALCALVFVAACASTESAEKTHAYTLVLIKTGPQSGKLPKEENQRLFAGHFENMAHMAEERKLVVAGPYGGERHDKALRGLFVLDTGDRTVATTWAETDPPTKAGIFVLEYHELRTETNLLPQLEHELARTAKAKAEGKVTAPGEGARSYVLLVAEKGDVAHRELADLVAAKHVYLLAELDKVGAFAILDAKDLAAAHELLGPRAAKLGTYTLDEWFASDSLETLAH